MYKDSLETVVFYSAKEFRVTWKGAWDVTLSSFTYKSFYTAILPMLARRLLPKTLFHFLLRMKRAALAALRALRLVCRKVGEWWVSPITVGL